MVVKTPADLKADMPIGGINGTSVQDIHNVVDTVEDLTTQSVVDLTANYTATVADNRRFFTMNNAAATTFSIPNTVPKGWECSIVQIGAGQVQVLVPTGELHHPDSHTRTFKLWSMIYIKCTWNSANFPVIVISGDTAL